MLVKISNLSDKETYLISYTYIYIHISLSHKSDILSVLLCNPVKKYLKCIDISLIYCNLSTPVCVFYISEFIAQKYCFPTLVCDQLFKIQLRTCTKIMKLVSQLFHSISLRMEQQSKANQKCWKQFENIIYIYISFTPHQYPWWHDRPSKRSQSAQR